MNTDKRTFCVRFSNGVNVFVKSTNHENALRNARKKGYLKRDGFNWASIYPIEPVELP